MKYFKTFVSLIFGIFGIIPEKQRLFVLSPDGELNFDADTNEIISNVCAVSASYTRDSKSAENVVIRFKVLKGPFVFQTNGSTEIQVHTNNKGKASVNGHFTAQGFVVIVAELVEDRKVSVFFRGHSNGVTDRLFMYTEPCVSVNPGKVIAKIVALDRNGLPITGGNIHFEGAYSGDQIIIGTVREIGNGEYEGTFQTHTAGSYRVMAQDRDTHVLTYTNIEVLPGTPHQFNFIGDTDPRVSQPYGELLLRVQLQDEYGNGLDPHRINCQVNGQVLSPLTVFAREVRFPVSLAGYGTVDIQLSDSGSSVEKKASVKFASAWLQDPGLIFKGDHFTTPLYWLPSTDRPVQEATIEITFNPELASFKGFKPHPEGPMNSQKAEVGNNLVTIQINSEVPVSASDHPDGIYIGDITWNCLAEGITCFNLVAFMSSPTPGWEMCVPQKNRNKKCLCVNIIYKPGDTAGRDAGITAAKQVESVISSELNVKICCPIIEVKTDTHELTPDEWVRVNTAMGDDGHIAGEPDAVAVDGVGAGYKTNCININMIPFSVTGLAGMTDVGPPGNSAIDPNQVGRRPNLGAHEIGHALGAPQDHSDAGGDPDNLMHPPDPITGHGNKLTKEQCKKFWENIDNYPCA